MISYNQLVHKSYEKYDTESDEGQTAFKNYLEHLELLFPVPLFLFRHLKRRLVIEVTETPSRKHTVPCTMKGSYVI